MFHPIIEKLGLDRDDRVVAYSADSTPASDYQITYNPAPIRGELVRQCGLALREHQEAIGELVSLEMGKIRAEGEGEVQEMPSTSPTSPSACRRQLYGLTIASERPATACTSSGSRSAIGIITAFNFPAAVWAWNSMIAAVCGDVCDLEAQPKHASHRRRDAQHLPRRSRRRFGHPDIFNLIIGRPIVIGEAMNADRRLPLISATGSCRMGRQIGAKVSQRLGRPSSNWAATTPSSSASTPTSTWSPSRRRLRRRRHRRTAMHLHPATHRPRDIIDPSRTLVDAYKQVRIGDPLDPDTLMGPLINEDAVKEMMNAIEKAKEQGGEIISRRCHARTGRALRRAPPSSACPGVRSSTSPG
jgi:aldehyde dehydrogenase (NAD+)